jgi:hypothetical protein
MYQSKNLISFIKTYGSDIFKNIHPNARKEDIEKALVRNRTSRPFDIPFAEFLISNKSELADYFISLHTQKSAQNMSTDNQDNNLFSKAINNSLRVYRLFEKELLSKLSKGEAIKYSIGKEKKNQAILQLTTDKEGNQQLHTYLSSPKPKISKAIAEQINQKDWQKMNSLVKKNKNFTYKLLNTDLTIEFMNGTLFSKKTQQSITLDLQTLQQKTMIKR